MTHLCEGKCGRHVADEGKYCFVCWADMPTQGHDKLTHSIDGILANIVNHPVPERRTPERESLRTRLSILNLAHAYALGPESDRERNLNQLVHLTHVAQHEQHLLNTEKEK